MESEKVLKLLRERYLLKNEHEWDDIARRVGNFLAANERESKDFYTMIRDKDLLPNSPTLMNAGTDNPQLSACFFLPIEDCISNGKDGIFDQVKNAAMIFKSGGGVGLNFSKLRPAGSPVRSTNGVASGVISFMNNFNTMTETIKQGGKRRGALMGSLDVDHPEIKQFLTSKKKEGDLSNFNISVKLTDKFMESPDPEIMNLIVDGIYNNGEPGVLFRDTIEKYNKHPEFGELNCNPCSEALLYPAESCNLASINLSHMLTNDGNIDWVKLGKTVENGVILLNRVIDKNKYPLPEIHEASHKTRKIGLGVMGYHHMLIRMRIPYNSPEADDIGKQLMNFIYNEAKRVSEKYKFNNTNLTSIAPTGTISLIADTSSSIEPVFNWVIERKDSIGSHYMVDPLFEEYLDTFLDGYSDSFFIDVDDKRYYSRSDAKVAIMDHCYRKGTIQDISALPIEFRKLFVNAMDINWKDHIRVQSIFQNNGVDMSISKTINFPKTATKDEIRQALYDAWRLGCKGVTMYRDGSRENAVLNLKKDSKDIKQFSTNGRSYKRPKMLSGATYKALSGCGKLYITINEDHDGNPYEVLIRSEAGGCESGNDALARMISVALRNHVPVQSVIKQLKKVRCSAAMKNPLSEGKSCADVIGKIMLDYLPDNDEEDEDELPDTSLIKTCPECGSNTLIREGGCNICKECGYSKCG